MMSPHDKLLSAIFGPKPGEEGPADASLIRRMMDVREASILAEAAKADAEFAEWVGGEIKPALFYGMPAAFVLKDGDAQQIHRMGTDFGVSDITERDVEHLEILG